MMKPPKNKAILVPSETTGIDPESTPAPIELNIPPEVLAKILAPETILKAKGWKYVEEAEAIVPNKRWKDPQTSGYGSWFYTLDQAIQIQKDRDGK